MQILWQAKMGRCHGNKWRPICGGGWLPPGWISRPRRARQWLFGLQKFFGPGIIHTQADSRRRCVHRQNRVQPSGTGVMLTSVPWIGVVMGRCTRIPLFIVCNVFYWNAFGWTIAMHLHYRSTPLRPVQHCPQLRIHIENCNELEEVVFWSMLRAAPQHQRPAIPMFSTKAAGFAEQFQIGHYNRWKKIHLTYGQHGMYDDTPLTPHAIRHLYRWQQGHRPYIKPSPRRSRAALALAQIEVIVEERCQKEAKKKGKTVPPRCERQGQLPAPASETMGMQRQRRCNSASAQPAWIRQSVTLWTIGLRLSAAPCPIR